MKKDIMIKRCNQISVLIHLAASFLAYYIMEALSRHSILAAYEYMTSKPLVFLYNMGLLFASSFIVYLFKRRVFLRSILLVFWLGIGIINCIILCFRVTPFTGPDIMLIGDALKLITTYINIPLIIIGAVCIIVIIVLLCFLWYKAPHFKGKLHRLAAGGVLLVAAFAIIAATQFSLKSRILSQYFGNIAFAYEDYGLPYCLATTLFNTGISMPDNYSKESIDALTSYNEDGILPASAEVDAEDEMPNIIFLQLETFFDPATVEFLELSEDPIPNFRALMEEYSSGHYKVPSVGAGTANTEFETITGMNLRYFGPGEYPYKTVLKSETCESVPYVLKNLGYTAHAIHNNDGDFYDRNIVFSNLGFDTFTSLEYMDVEEFTATGWAKDSCLTQVITDCMNSTPGADYIYTISVQGHGEYPAYQVLEDPKIKVSGLDSEEDTYAWEYYINQLYEMDQFVKELTDTLSESEEDIVLVMFGDHLPTMGLKAQDLSTRYLYQTEYVIWDNMGLEKVDQNIYAYQIAAEVLDKLDIHSGNLITYHQSRKNTKHYLADLEELQYDILYGEQYSYDGESPYEPTDLQMGVYPIRITSAVYTRGKLYVYGSKFTKYSRIVLNGTICETEVIDKNTLSAEIDCPVNEDVITVGQLRAGGHGLLSESGLYIWHDE